ncbi:hypothetical protein ES332_A13G204400v1 [Gossypium tomentosum]|uniref:AT-hook motif nuclear-localized protein n=1 Tax=Gossypium tomentosum TaxID=34277 RepID=A0A5D2MMT2_GOSTO|nr:hypothetical protein ES332_A13G204400v1 [Gossypium tomentosum]
MEPNETHHHQHYFTTTTTTTVTTTPSTTNGLLLHNESGGSHNMLYPHSVPSAVTSPLEPTRRKRGRPRKYGTPEQAMAAKKTASLSSKERREQQQLQQLALGGTSGSLFGSSKKSQFALGNAGQSFTPHVINVVAGEDVGQKIMMFMQQNKHEICILSASGTISNASLRQPATSGGNIAYEGRFEIISLSGSYVRTEIGGRTGGLSACLLSADGQIIGGGVGGPLKAAGPVQVIVGTFVIDDKKDVSAGAKGDPVGGASVSNVVFRSAFETSGRNPIGGNDDHHHHHQSFGGSHFMMQPQGMHMTSWPTDWGSGLGDRTGFELTGKTGLGIHQSLQNGEYGHMAD